MFGKHNQVRDGAMTMALMLDLLSKSEFVLSENISNLPPNYTTKTKIECSVEASKTVIKQLQKDFPSSAITINLLIPRSMAFVASLVPFLTLPV